MQKKTEYRQNPIKCDFFNIPYSRIKWKKHISGL